MTATATEKRVDNGVNVEALIGAGADARELSAHLAAYLDGQSAARATLALHAPPIAHA